MDISPCRFIHSALLRRVANEIEHQHCHFATACLVMENSRAAKDMSSATPAAFAALPPARLSRENYFRRQGSVCARRQGAARQVPTCSGETPRLPRGFGKGRPANGKAMGKGDGEVGFVGADHLGISFTCGVCETRVAKSIRRKSYEEGVCLVQCPGCKKHHGMFPLPQVVHLRGVRAVGRTYK